MSEEEREELLRRIEAGEKIPFSERKPVWFGLPTSAEVSYLTLAGGSAEMATTLGYDLDDEPTVETE